MGDERDPRLVLSEESLKRWKLEEISDGEDRHQVSFEVIDDATGKPVEWEGVPVDAPPSEREDYARALRRASERIRSMMRRLGHLEPTVQVE